MPEKRHRKLHAVPVEATNQRYGEAVATELRIKLPGPEGSADAQRAFLVLSKVTSLLGALDRARVASPGRTIWAISHLGHGSVETALRVGRPRPGLTVTESADELRALFDGFAQAQAQDGAPPGWPQQAVKIGAEIGRYLGPTSEEGMLLGLDDDVHGLRNVTITRIAGDHLSAALLGRRTSIGSLIGYIEEINTHKDRNTARLWLDHPRCFVEVSFKNEDMGRVRDALTRRVMVAGRLERSSSGQPLKIRMRDLTVLPQKGELPQLTDLAGVDPDFIGGMDPVEYVRNLRDSA